MCPTKFIGRDKNGVKARYCSRLCACRDRNTREHQINAGKVAGLLNIKRLRGTGVKTYVKEYGRHQHRVVMERILGRKLNDDEIVHHIDENKKNNNPKNLQVMTQSQHARLHFTKHKVVSSPRKTN